jgi:hypothetical protein
MTRVGSMLVVLTWVPWKIPGKKLFAHIDGPMPGMPGQSATKPGRLAFSVPRP